MVNKNRGNFFIRKTSVDPPLAVTTAGSIARLSTLTQTERQTTDRLNRTLPHREPDQNRQPQTGPNPLHTDTDQNRQPQTDRQTDRLKPIQTTSSQRTRPKQTDTGRDDQNRQTQAETTRTDSHRQTDRHRLSDRPPARPPVRSSKRPTDARVQPTTRPLNRRDTSDGETSEATLTARVAVSS